MTKHSSTSSIIQLSKMNRQKHKFSYSNRTPLMALPLSNNTTSHVNVINKPLILPKHDLQGHNITNQKQSYLLEKQLILSKSIKCKLLDTQVSIANTSITIIDPNNSNTPTFEVINGTIDRCYKVFDAVRYRITLHTSNYVLEVDPHLCYHIVQLTNTPEPYKYHVYHRPKNSTMKHNELHKRSDETSTIQEHVLKTHSHKDTSLLSNQCCTFCDFSSIKRPKQIHKELHDVDQHNDYSNCTFLECSICNLSSCSKCLKSLISKMDDNNDTEDQWYKQTKKYLLYDILPKKFIGHCCELKNSISNHQLQNEKMVDEHECRDIKYDGYLHFPQVHILLDSPMVNHVDVHGLGKEDVFQGTPGLIHGVVDKYCATECARKNIIPSGSLTKVRVSHQSSIEFTDVFNNTSKLRYLLEVFDIDDTVETKSLKHQRPTTEDIKNSLCLNNDMKDIDVWIVLGMSKSVDSGCQLINMRWNSHLDKNKWNNSLNVKDLYNNLLSKCKNKGIQAQRSGGSNGVTTLSNNDILRLISTNGAFPRKGKGVKIIKEKTRWKCYYIGVRKKKNNFVSWNYQQPQRGGNFKMNKELQQKYKDITSAMTIAKYNTALLAVQISKILLTKVQAKAVQSAINDIDEVRSSLDNSHLDNSVSIARKKKKIDIDDELIKQLCLRNKFTLVAYPCGYHYDVFDKKAHSLENKICFSYDACLNNNCKEIGRGGDGNGKFVFAILDWTSH